MNDHVILGVHIHDRLNHAGDVQKVLTAFGTNIKTRLGLHEPATASEGTNGLLLLEVVGEAAKVKELETQLGKLRGVTVQKMVFSHS